MGDRQLRTPGFIAVMALAMLLQFGLLIDGVRRDQDVVALLSGLGLVVMTFTLMLVILQRVRLHEVVSVTLWLAGSWFLLIWVTFWQRQSTPLDLYLAHLIWVGLTCMFLPIRQATGLSTLSGALVAVAVVTAPGVDWALLLAVSFIAGLIGFVSVHGNSLREEILAQGRHQATGLLIGRAALFALEDTYRRQMKQVAGLGILVIVVGWFDDSSTGHSSEQGVKELAGLIRREMEAGDFVCLRDEHTFLVVLTSGLPMQVVDRAQRLVERVHGATVTQGPVVIRSGLALAHERQQLLDLVTLARQRSFQALETGRNDLVWEDDVRQEQK